MITLRQHDKDATLAPDPSWRDRINSLEGALGWTQRLSEQAIEKWRRNDAGGAARLWSVACHFYNEAERLESHV